MDLLMIAGTNRNSKLGYVVALATVGLAFLLRQVAGDLLLAYPFALFVPPVLVAAFFGGPGPALFAAALSIGIVEYGIAGNPPPAMAIAPYAWPDLIFFILLALTLALLVEALIAALAARNAVQATLNDINNRLDAIIEERSDELKLAMDDHANAQAHMRQAQKMETIGQLTGGVAHDFNNMLAVIVGSLDIADRRLAKGLTNETRQCIANAREGARRAAILTARLLAFSRQQPLSPEVLDGNGLLSNMSDGIRQVIGDDIRIVQNFAPGLWPSFVDRTQLETALVNLVTNARDAMPNGGTLTLETANTELDEKYAKRHPEVRAGQYVAITLKDTGTGMAADVVDRVFDPFYTTKGPGSGTGLGLSQVFGFIKQSGGHITLTSEPGQGTEVRIYLPRSQQTAPAVAHQAGPTAVLPKATRNEIVLVVEDEDNVRHMTVEALKELGYSVIEASGGKDALQQLSAHPHVDVLFTDIVMPEMNGKMVADAIRDRYPGIKIVYTTGYTRNAIVHNGIVDPAVDLLTKPFTLEQLAIKISGVLKRP